MFFILGLKTVMIINRASARSQSVYLWCSRWWLMVTAEITKQHTEQRGGDGGGGSHSCGLFEHTSCYDTRKLCPQVSKNVYDYLRRLLFFLLELEVMLKLLLFGVVVWQGYCKSTLNQILVFTLLRLDVCTFLCFYHPSLEQGKIFSSNVS